MRSVDTTNRQLISELELLQQRVAELEELDAEHKQVERLSSDLLNSSPVGIYMIQEGKFKLVNPKFRKLIGYTESELLEMHSMEIVLPEDRDVVREHAVNMLKGKRSSPYEYRYVSKSGQTGWVTESVTSIQYQGRRATLGSFMDITERKRAEEALGQSEERYRTILEEMDDGYFEVDLAGNYTFVNDSMCCIRGYPREELMGMNYRGLTPKEDVAHVYKAYNRVYRTGEPLRGFSRETIRKDGSRALLEISASLLRNPTGKVVGFRGIGNDVTERKRAEEKLKESEARYRNLVETALEGVCITDGEEAITFANLAFAEMLGYKPEELVGQSSRKLVSDEDWFKICSEAKKRRRGERSRYDITLLGKKGIAKFVTVSASPFLGPDGRFLGSLGVIMDITERKRAEEALRQSQAQMQVILESLPYGIAQVDTDQRITWTNKRNLAISSNPVGQFCYEAYVRRDEPCEGCPCRKAMDTGQIETGTLCIAGAHAEYNFEVIGVPLQDSSGKVTGAIEIGRDITKRIRAEEERRQLEQKAQLASRLASVGEMASGIAHEINNPLTGVIGFSQLLMEKDLPDDIKDDVRIIHDGAQRVAGIVKRLLTFARQHKPERTYININDLIESTLALRAYELKTNSIELITQLDPELPGTIADFGQLQQVFLNLIVNAETEMKSAHGKGKLIIRTEKIDSTIRISFKDDGPGIARENLDRVFNPFFTTREVGKGTGLGLSVCHGIVVEHGGSIYAKNNLGKGATFVVELPVVTESEQLNLAEPAVEEAKKATKAKILVVDDEPTVLSFLSQVLTGEGTR